MRQSFKSILRFLFPELQIIDAVKQDGFIAKKSSVKNMHMANNAVAGNAVVQQNTGMPTAQPSFSKATRASAPKASTVSSSVSVSADKVDDKFEGIEQQLRKTWIASNNNIFALCQAFKRPFVVGTDATTPKNSILLIGNESRGKTKAITDICAVLKQKRLLRYAEVPVVGFERYPTNSEDDLFLSDIYKALYSQSDVIVGSNSLYKKRKMPNSNMRMGTNLLFTIQPFRSTALSKDMIRWHLRVLSESLIVLSVWQRLKNMCLIWKII